MDDSAQPKDETPKSDAPATGEPTKGFAPTDTPSTQSPISGPPPAPSTTYTESPAPAAPAPQPEVGQPLAKILSSEPETPTLEPKLETPDEGAGLPPVISPPAPKKSKAKIVGSILALLILVVSLPIGVFLVQQVQEIRERAREIECYNDSECPSGYACKDYRCVPKPECVSNADCPAGYICQAQKCVQKPECTSDADCAAGYRCESNKCVPKPECTSDADCPAGYRCEAQKCVAKPTSTPTPRPTPTPTPSPTKTPTPQPGTLFCDVSGTSITLRNTTGVAIAYEVTEFRGCKYPGDPSGKCQGDQYRTKYVQPTVNAGVTKTESMNPAGACGVVQLDVRSLNGSFPCTRSDGRVWDGGVAYVISSNSNCATPPPGEAQCRNIKVYDANWNQIPASELPNLKAGNSIRIAVSGTTTSGTIDKAGFRVNGGTWQETTLKNPFGEYYIVYTITTGVTSFKFEAMVHHKESNQWF